MCFQTSVILDFYLGRPFLIAANKFKQKEGITHQGLKHQLKKGNSLQADCKKHPLVISSVRADGPGIVSLLLALASERPGQAQGEMVFHITRIHHEKMGTPSPAGKPNSSVLRSSSRAHTVARGHAPLTLAPSSSARSWSPGTGLWLMGIPLQKANQTVEWAPGWLVSSLLCQSF